MTEDLTLLVDDLRSLGDGEIAADVADRHIAMIAKEVGVSPQTGSVHEPVPSGSAPRPRRRLVLSSLLSTMLAKVLAASVAVAAVGTGLGVAASDAVPGDALYSLNQALQKMGIGQADPEERIEQARSLLDADLPRAVARAGQAVETLGNEEAAGALFQAAERIRSVEAEQSEQTRDAVASLLESIAQQVAEGRVVGEDVAEIGAGDRRLDKPISLAPAQVGEKPRLSQEMHHLHEVMLGNAKCGSDLGDRDAALTMNCEMDQNPEAVIGKRCQTHSSIPINWIPSPSMGEG